MFLCWVAMGLGMAGVGMTLMHDANHGSFAKSQQVNKWLSGSLFLLGGFPQNWKFQHNALHHGFTNIDGQDEDIKGLRPLRFSPHKPYYNIHRYQHWYAWFFYSLMTISWIGAKDFTGVLRYKKMDAPQFKNKNNGRLLFEVTLSKLVYYSLFLVLPIIIMPFSWYWIIAGFLSMHLVSGFILTIIFQTAHVMPDSIYPLPDENGNMDNNWAVHQLMTTTDYSPSSRIFSWMIGGLNYQIEHHLFPNISHVHYRKISEIVRSTAQKYNLPYTVQPNFATAVRKHTRMLKALGRPENRFAVA
jgi:linoleoyl-CoA desaturase